MTMVLEAVNFSPMAKAREKTRQVNFRLAETKLARMDRVNESHPLKPTLTQIVDAALEAYLPLLERELPAADKPARKGKQ